MAQGENTQGIHYVCLVRYLGDFRSPPPPQKLFAISFASPFALPCASAFASSCVSGCCPRFAHTRDFTVQRQTDAKDKEAEEQGQAVPGSFAAVQTRPSIRNLPYPSGGPELDTLWGLG